MLRSGLLLSALFVGFISFQGCDKKKSDCGFIAPKMVYVGFSESESDTLIIRRYKKETMFSELVDTFLVSKANITRTVIGADSIVLSPANYTRMNYEFYANNWEVALPGANHTDRFYDVQPRFAQESEPSAHCQSFVKSMNANGVTVNYNTWSDGNYNFFIT
ncbi:MAG: hypothetical protein EOO04_10735, partial [Chitinophagaceae bacterium]